jgi:gliding motility-associated-like protein
MTVLDTNQCSINIPYQILEPEPTVVDKIITTPETCIGSCDGTLTVFDPEGVSLTFQGTASATNTFITLCAGIYLVTTIDANGCQANGTGVVFSPDPIVADFSFAPDTVFIDDPQVSFNNLSSSNAISFSWNFAGLGDSDAFEPTFVFPSDLGGAYEVCLVASDENGCTNEFCASVNVLDLLLTFVPNAFSPNGDGVNDEFLPVFNLPWIVDYEFLIFNRWGERIFNADKPGVGWDGQHGGVGSKDDVYVWKLICKDQYSGDLIDRTGHVTLLK